MSEVRFFNAIEGMALASVKVVVPYSPTPITTLTLYHGATTDTAAATAYQANWYGLLMYGGEFDFVTGKVTLSYDAEGNPISKTAQGVATPITALTGMNVFWTDAGEVQVSGEGFNKNGFTFAGVSSLLYGVGLSGSGVYDAPVRKGENISVPGGNRTIWLDGGGFENVDITYPCWIAEGFDERVDGFRAFLMAHSDAFYRLTDSYHPDEYRMARYSTPFVADPGTRNYSGRFDVTFSCQPERYLISGDTEITLGEETTITNPTDFPAFPMITVSGTAGTVFDLNVGGIDWLGEIPSTPTGDLVLDTRTLAFYMKNGNTLTAIPVAGTLNFLDTDANAGWLQPGTNEVFLHGEGGATVDATVTLRPRWWTI